MRAAESSGSPVVIQSIHKKQAQLARTRVRRCFVSKMLKCSTLFTQSQRIKLENTLAYKTVTLETDHCGARCISCQQRASAEPRCRP